MASVQETVAGQGLDRGREAIAHQGGELARRLPVTEQDCPLGLVACLPIRLRVAQGYQGMTLDAVALLPHQVQPLAPVADAGGFVEQPDGLARLGQGRELRPARVIGRQQQLFAVQDGGIQGIDVGPQGRGPRLRVHQPTRRQGREGVVEKVGVVEQCHGRAVQVQADQVVALAPDQAGKAFSRGYPRLERVIRPIQRAEVQVTSRPYSLSGYTVHSANGPAS